MSSAADFLLLLIQNHPVLAYAFIFVVSVPRGPLLTVLCGFLSTQGILNPFIVYLLVVTGDVIGDSLLYAAGRFGEKIIPARFKEKLGLTPERLQRAKRYIETRGIRMLVLSKLMYGPGAAGLVIAGSLRVSYRRYVLGCFRITLVQSATLLTLGLFTGSAYQKVESYMNIYVAAVCALMIVLIAFLVIRHLKYKVTKIAEICDE